MPRGPKGEKRPTDVNARAEGRAAPCTDNSAAYLSAQLAAEAPPGGEGGRAPAAARRCPPRSPRIQAEILQIQPRKRHS